MISHKHQCIFIHIQRTGGTSIEHWFLNHTMWDENPSLKHLTAPQAKLIYKDYWNDYYKFSIIRNPYNRFVSMFKYRNHFCLKLDKNNELNIKNYIKKYCPNINQPLEYDHRFISFQEIEYIYKKFNTQLNEGSLYQNILGEEMDDIFKYEELDGALKQLASRFNLNIENFLHKEKFNNKGNLKLNSESLEIIKIIHKNDFEKFKLNL